ncbi:uncharacterized protein LOC143034684 [Oratosquilla oratoria]|uniref:uncharacterized protein LOC143034684 n=1 Tax=Oratosquilla oratoria TaxID=337810 RepID=UPI003F770F75
MRYILGLSPAERIPCYTLAPAEDCSPPICTFSGSLTSHFRYRGSHACHSLQQRILYSPLASQQNPLLFISSHQMPLLPKPFVLAKTKQTNYVTITREPEEIDRRWKEYFSSLLNIDEDSERTDEEQTNGVWVDDEEGINESEVKKALAKIKNNKACGIDNIPGEIFKYGGGIALSLLTELLSKAWDTGKTYERVFEARLRDIVEHILAEARHGFRPNRGTSDLIFPLKMILKNLWEFDKGKYVTLDKETEKKKAFDRVPRDKMWSVLQSAEYQIPPKLRRAIKILYNSNNTAVKPVSETLQWFDISSAVRQGSVLSPMLFFILMDVVIKEVQFRRGERNPIESLEFAYADDILNIESSSHVASESLNLWNAVLTEYGLKLNLGKTEIMVVSRREETLNMEFNGVPIQQKESVKYLGVVWNGKAKYESTVEARTAAYSQNLGLLYPFMKDRNVPTTVKIVIYGCESWNLTIKTSN